VTGNAMKESRNTTELLKQLINIGIVLTSERDMSVLVERIVVEARRFTNAESGTLFLREGDSLRFSVVQNEWGPRRTGELVPIDLTTLAGYVATTNRALAIPDPAPIPELAGRALHGIQSALIVPLADPAGDVIGVLQLLHARDARGNVVPFDEELTGLVRSLAAQAAVAIRNSMLEDLSFKDPLTGAYNRRYFTMRIEEEGKRYTRFGEPVSLVLIDVDFFKNVNDQHGHEAGDDVLREFTQLLVNNSRNFSIVTRYGGDEFAVLLVNTPKAGAIRYADRIQRVVESHGFKHGGLTVSIGVASLPADVASADELLPAADRALYVAKQRGRNSVQSA
jgi:diguanylate cyclase (GGDEF)-like protein